MLTSSFSVLSYSVLKFVVGTVCSRIIRIQASFRVVPITIVIQGLPVILGSDVWFERLTAVIIDQPFTDGSQLFRGWMHTRDVRFPDRVPGIYTVEESVRNDEKNSVKDPAVSVGVQETGVMHIQQSNDRVRRLVGVCLLAPLVAKFEMPQGRNDLRQGMGTQHVHLKPLQGTEENRVGAEVSFEDVERYMKSFFNAGERDSEIWEIVVIGRDVGGEVGHLCFVDGVFVRVDSYGDFIRTGSHFL